MLVHTPLNFTGIKGTLFVRNKQQELEARVFDFKKADSFELQTNDNAQIVVTEKEGEKIKYQKAFDSDSIEKVEIETLDNQTKFKANIPNKYNSYLMELPDIAVSTVSNGTVEIDGETEAQVTTLLNNSTLGISGNSSVSLISMNKSRLSAKDNAQFSMETSNNSTLSLHQTAGGSVGYIDHSNIELFGHSTLEVGSQVDKQEFLQEQLQKNSFRNSEESLFPMLEEQTIPLVSDGESLDDLFSIAKADDVSPALVSNSFPVAVQDYEAFLAEKADKYQFLGGINQANILIKGDSKLDTSILENSSLNICNRAYVKAEFVSNTNITNMANAKGCVPNLVVGTLQLSSDNDLNLGMSSINNIERIHADTSSPFLKECGPSILLQNNANLDAIGVFGNVTISQTDNSTSSIYKLGKESSLFLYNAKNDLLNAEIQIQERNSEIVAAANSAVFVVDQDGHMNITDNSLGSIGTLNGVVEMDGNSTLNVDFLKGVLVQSGDSSSKITSNTGSIYSTGKGKTHIVNQLPNEHNGQPLYHNSQNGNIFQVDEAQTRIENFVNNCNIYAEEGTQVISESKNAPEGFKVKFMPEGFGFMVNQLIELVKTKQKAGLL